MDTVTSGYLTWAVSRDSAFLAIRQLPAGLWVTARGAPMASARIVERDPVFYPSFSPDGKWLLYTKDVDGRYEIFVVPLSDLTQKRRLSRGGGEKAVWSHTGDQIVYRAERTWYSVRVSGSSSQPFGDPEERFSGDYPDVTGWSHDVLPDGRMLLLLTPSESTTNTVHVVSGWFSELRRLAPAGVDP